VSEQRLSWRDPACANLAFAIVVCIALLLWMFKKREPRRKQQALLPLCAWLVTPLIYWIWNIFAQTKYASASVQ
jgi:uncharacterized membrane protein YqjE